MTRATSGWLILLAAITWYVLCEVLASVTRRKQEGYNSFPTFWSDFFSWLASIGAVVILATALLWRLMSDAP